MPQEKKSFLEKKLIKERKPCWEIWNEKTKKQALGFAKGYKKFITAAKTERMAVVESKKLADEQGFLDFEKVIVKSKNWQAGSKVYIINRDKNIVLATKGKRALTNGLRMILAHIDSPRLDLKLSPLYEDEKIAFFKTHYYGGIKKYHWPALPLALHGVIAKKDRSKVEIHLGEKEDEPSFIITDLLPHLAKKQLEKKLMEAIEAEELNLVVGSFSLDEKDAKEKVKLNLLKLLKENFGVEQDDFISAEIAAVPAGVARDVGFDKSLIAAYGHDDKICAYTALQALLAQKNPELTTLVMLVDKEETGSESATGMHSNFFYDFVGRLLSFERGFKKEQESDTDLRAVLRNSKAISADVTAALDPDYKDVADPKNAARLGFGIALERYTGARGKYGTSEASAEYTAEIREIFDRNKIIWQPATLGKVDVGGGGTIAMYLARFNMDILDAGLPLLNMHAPFEIASIADLYSTFQAYQVFLKG